jgi:hypothetical protein
MHVSGKSNVRSPAKAGAYLSAVRAVGKWVPAFAGKRSLMIAGMTLMEYSA